MCIPNHTRCNTDIFIILILNGTIRFAHLCICIYMYMEGEEERERERERARGREGGREGGRGAERERERCKYKYTIHKCKSVFRQRTTYDLGVVLEARGLKVLLEHLSPCLQSGCVFIGLALKGLQGPRVSIEVSGIEPQKRAVKGCGWMITVCLSCSLSSLSLSLSLCLCLALYTGEPGRYLSGVTCWLLSPAALNLSARSVLAAMRSIEGFRRALYMGSS